VIAPAAGFVADDANLGWAQHTSVQNISIPSLITAPATIPCNSLPCCLRATPIGFVSEGPAARSVISPPSLERHEHLRSSAFICD